MRRIKFSFRWLGVRQSKSAGAVTGVRPSNNGLRPTALSRRALAVTRAFWLSIHARQMYERFRHCAIDICKQIVIWHGQVEKHNG